MLFLCVLVVALLMGSFVVLATGGGRDRVTWPLLLLLVVVMVGLALWPPRAHLYAGIDGLVLGVLGATILLWFQRRRALRAAKGSDPKVR